MKKLRGDPVSQTKSPDGCLSDEIASLAVGNKAFSRKPPRRARPPGTADCLRHPAWSARWRWWMVLRRLRLALALDTCVRSRMVRGEGDGQAERAPDTNAGRQRGSRGPL